MTTPWIQILSTNGDGTGTTDMAGNYASAAETFEVVPPRTAIGVRMLIYYVDTGTMDATLYGNGITLTNGISVKYIDTADGDDVVTDLTPNPVLTNGDWKSYAYDVMHDTFGTGPETIGVRWTFAKFAPPGLRLSPTRKLVVTLNDDLTGLDSMTMTVEGYYPESI